MSWTTDAKKGLELASSALHGLEHIGDLSHQALGGNKTVDELRVIVSVIAAITDALRGGFEGKVTTEHVEKQLAALKSKLAQDDADVDSAIDRKFKGDGEA